MGRDSQNATGDGGLLARARGALARRQGGASLKDRLRLVGQLASGDRQVRARALVALLEGSLNDLADMTAGSLLSLDEAAAELGLLAETVAQQHGRERVVSVVLRRNPFLNGTILALIEPALTGRDRLDVRAEVTDKGRATLLDLLVGVLAIDHPDAPDDDGFDAKLAWLQDQPVAAQLEHVLPFVRGEADDEQTVRFLLGSYAIFLNAFLIRSTAQMLTRTMAPPFAIAQEPEGDPPPLIEPTTA